MAFLAVVFLAGANETRQCSSAWSHRQRRQTVREGLSTSLAFVALWNSAVCGNFGGGIDFDTCVRNDAAGGEAHRLGRWECGGLFASFIMGVWIRFTKINLGVGAEI